jgi:hypothetical protein
VLFDRGEGKVRVAKAHVLVGYGVGVEEYELVGW